MMAPTSVGQTTLVEDDLVLLAQLILRHTMKGSVGLTTMPVTTPSVPDAFSGVFQLCHRSSTGEFSFHLPLIHMLVSLMVFAFYFQIPMWLPCSQMQA